MDAMFSPFDADPTQVDNPNAPVDTAASGPTPLELAEMQITAEMRERIARVLMAFYLKGATDLESKRFRWDESVRMACNDLDALTCAELFIERCTLASKRMSSVQNYCPRLVLQGSNGLTAIAVGTRAGMLHNVVRTIIAGIDDSLKPQYGLENVQVPCKPPLSREHPRHPQVGP